MLIIARIYVELVQFPMQKINTSGDLSRFLAYKSLSMILGNPEDILAIIVWKQKDMDIHTHTHIDIYTYLYIDTHF